MFAWFSPRRFLAAALGASCVLLATAGCGNGQKAPATQPTSVSPTTASTAAQGSTAGSAPASKAISIVVTHYPSILDSVPYIVAMDNGYFKQEGIRISSISGSSGGGTTVRALINGDLAFGDVATPAAIKATLAGSQLRFVSIGIGTVGDIVVAVRGSSSLHSIKDLVGKKVAYSHPGSVGQGVLVMSLLGAGITPSTVQMTSVGSLGNEFTLLDKGAVAAAVLPEPPFSLHSAGKRILYRSSEYVPAFPQTVIVPNTKILKNDPQLITDFLIARAHAIAWIKGHLDQAGAMWAKAAKISDAVATKVLTETLKASPTYYQTGFSVKAMTAVVKEMRAIGLLKQNVSIPWSTLIDQKVLPKNVQRIDVSQIKSK